MRNDNEIIGRLFLNNLQEKKILIYEIFSYYLEFFFFFCNFINLHYFPPSWQGRRGVGRLS